MMYVCVLLFPSTPRLGLYLLHLPMHDDKVCVGCQNLNALPKIDFKVSCYLKEFKEEVGRLICILSVYKSLFFVDAYGVDLCRYINHVQINSVVNY